MCVYREFVRRIVAKRKEDMLFDAEYMGLQRREETLDEIFGNGKSSSLRVNWKFSTGDLIRRFVEVVVGEGVWV